MPNVLAVLPRGEAIRNFVYSGVLDQLANQVDLSVASVIPNEVIAELLSARYGPIIELGPGRDRRSVGALRDLLDMAHGRWLWSEAAQERWRLHDTYVASGTGRLKRETKKAVGRALAHQPALARMTTLYERAAAEWPPDSSSAKHLQEAHYDLVFNGSHVHSRNVEGLLSTAKRQGMPTAAFLFSWDNLTSQGRIVPAYDWYLAWSDQIKSDLLRLYPHVDPAQVLVTGTPQFDAHFRADIAWDRETYCEAIGVDPARPIVLYTTGMPNHMPGEPSLVEQMADLLASRSDLGRPQVVVRVYAKDNTGRFDPLKSTRPDIVFPQVAWEPNWLTPLPEDTALWSNMLRHADVGVNVASTVSLELCMFDKPVVNIAFNPAHVSTSEIEYARFYEFDHYAPVAASKAIEVARTPEQLLGGIVKGLRDPTGEAASRAALLTDLFGDHLDGKASDRVAAALAEIANSHQD